MLLEDGVERGSLRVEWRRVRRLRVDEPVCQTEVRLGASGNAWIVPGPRDAAGRGWRGAYKHYGKLQEDGSRLHRYHLSPNTVPLHRSRPARARVVLDECRQAGHWLSGRLGWLSAARFLPSNAPPCASGGTVRGDDEWGARLWWRRWPSTRRTTRGSWSPTSGRAATTHTVGEAALQRGREAPDPDMGTCVGVESCDAADFIPGRQVRPCCRRVDGGSRGDHA